MSTTSQDGQLLTVHAFFPESFFPLFGLVTSDENHYDFEALTPVEVKIAPTADVVEFLKTHPEVLYDTLLRMTRGLMRVTERVEQSVFIPAYNRVASLLLYFIRHFGQKSESGKIATIQMKVTHQDIAEWLGLSRENVSLQMKKLERSGLITRRSGRLVILNLPELQKLASENIAVF